MARYTIDIPTPYTPEEINNIINQFSQQEGFQFTNYKGEDVLKKGMGIMSAPQFIKVAIFPGTVHIEAWIKNAILPGVYIGEMGLDGFYGWAIKATLKGRVDRLIQSIAPAPMDVPAQA